MSAVLGLQPSVKVAPMAVITGGVTSKVHVTVLDEVEVLPQASVAVQIRVCDLSQPLLDAAPSFDNNIAAPQLSVAIALPRAASISAEIGLQPSVVVVPVAVIVGAVTSYVQLTIRDAV